MNILLSHTLITKPGSRTTTQWLQSLPTPLEEKNLGRVFGILEIDTSFHVQEELLSTIAEEFHQAFYSSEHFSTEAAFEMALQKTNKKIQEISAAVGEEWLEHYSSVLGAIHNEDVYFSSMGSIVGLMLYKEQLSELIDHTKGKKEIINPVKVFHHTVAGKIQHDTQLFFATESLYDYFSQEKIRRLLLGEDPRSVGEHIESLLREDAHTSLACAILAPAEGFNTHPTQVSDVPHTSLEYETTQSDSMSALMQKEEVTSKTLSGSLWSTIKSSAQSGSHSRVGKSMPHIVLSYAIQGLMFVGQVIVQGIMALGGLISSLISKKQASFSPRLGVSSRRASPISSVKRAGSAVWRWFMRLSNPQKAFLVTACVVGIILVQSVLSKNTEQVSDAKKTEYTSTLSTVDIKINEASAALIYDKQRARTLLNEAQELLNTIPDDADEFDQGVADRELAIRNQILAANNVTVLGAISPALEFGSLASAVDVTSISLLGSSIYAFDASGGRVYRGNLDTGEETVTINQSANPVTQVSKASLGTVLAVLQNNTLGLFNPVSESIKGLTVEFAQTNRSLVDARLFANRLYTLDTQNNQIFKHTKISDTAYARGTAWITDGTSVSQAKGFAIDGSIYVLRSSGEMLKFTGGNKDAFSLAAVDPALQSPTAFFTDENTSKIYVLDSSNQRVIVFNKDGSLSSQFQSEAFGSGKDIVVDESKKTAYVLSNNAIYLIALP